MAHYKVKYKGIGTHETYIEAVNEADAIFKVQSKHNFNLDNFRVKEIKVPTTEDYYFLRDVACFLTLVIIVLGVTILVRGG
ncbi:hypothetical protein [Enterococcus sp. N249-2]